MGATLLSEDIFGQSYDSSWLAIQVRWSSTLRTSFLAWIRFLQCLRRFHDDGSGTHLYNTAKYSTSFLKYGMAFYYAQEPTQSSFSLMCCAYFCSSAFTLYWDLIHDWEWFLNAWLNSNYGLKDFQPFKGFSSDEESEKSVSTRWSCLYLTKWLEKVLLLCNSRKHSTSIQLDSTGIPKQPWESMENF